MEAAVNTRYGPPEAVRIIDVPKQTVGDRDVLVKVYLATVNRTDCGFRAAKPFIVRGFSGVWRPRFTVLGTEFSGVVEAVGTAATTDDIGDRVFGYNEDRFGAHAQHLTMPDEDWQRLDQRRPRLTARLSVATVNRRGHRPESTRVWEVAQDLYCLGPRGRTQTNVYFVGSRLSWALIDTGWSQDAPAIKQAAGSLFGAKTRPTSILLTHFHPDHAGSALQLARAWACPVYVHPDELPLANGDFSAMRQCAGPLDDWVVLPLMRAMGRRRREAILAKSSLQDVARALEPGTGVPDLPGWECIPTPGHTPGHVSFFRAMDHALVTGDAIVTLDFNSVPGVLLQRPALCGPPRYTTWNWPAAKESVARLARIDVGNCGNSGRSHHNNLEPRRLIRGGARARCRREP